MLGQNISAYMNSTNVLKMPETKPVYPSTNFVRPVYKKFQNNYQWLYTKQS